MARQTSARIAGAAFLLYIVLGMAAVILLGRATAGPTVGERLVTITSNAWLLRATAVLTLLTCFAALTLAVTLYGLTREQDREIAMFGLVCRVGEGVIGGVSILSTVGLLWLATFAGTAQDPATVEPLAGLLLRAEAVSPIISATFFAVGSTAFCWLLLRGRMIPVAMAWLGVVASVLLVISLPMMLGGVLSGLPASLVWLPMLVFELAFAMWLLTRGVAEPPRSSDSFERMRA